jgi:hypothetical protein
MTLHVHYSTDYVAAAHEFDTTRKAAWVADAVRDLPGVHITAPSTAWDDAAVEAAIRTVHDGAYIDALATGQPRTLAESQGFGWDEGLWRAVRASTAGVLSAVDVVLDAPHRGHLLLPQRGQAVAKLGANPVAQEAAGQVDGDLVALDADQRHLAQPGAVLDLAHFLLEATAHARPLGGQLLGGKLIHCRGMLPLDVAVEHHRHASSPPGEGRAAAGAAPSPFAGAARHAAPEEGRDRLAEPERTRWSGNRWWRND